jgi:hypothetical protein
MLPPLEANVYQQLSEGKPTVRVHIDDGDSCDIIDFIVTDPNVRVIVNDGGMTDKLKSYATLYKSVSFWIGRGLTGMEKYKITEAGEVRIGPGFFTIEVKDLVRVHSEEELRERVTHVLEASRGDIDLETLAIDFEDCCSRSLDTLERLLARISEENPEIDQLDLQGYNLVYHDFIVEFISRCSINEVNISPSLSELSLIHI